MKDRRVRWRRAAGALVSMALFLVALVVLRGQLREHSLAEVRAALSALAPTRLLLAAAATVLGYTALTGCDALALSYLGRRLAYRRVALAGFIAFAFANSLPLSVVTGASVRFRLYSGWGLQPGDATRVTAFTTVTYVLGLLAAAGIAFAIQPVLVPGFLRLPLHTARPLGVLSLVLVATYLFWSVRGARALKIGSREFAAPSPRRALAQMVISGLDWALSGAALWVLLPPVVPFHVFFAVFLLGQMAALVAQVPGGLGVFEAVVLWCLAPTVPPPTMLGALFAYRVIYFLLPLMLAAGLWGGRELWRWRRLRPRA